MPIRFRCENCDSLLSVAERKAGSVVDCPKCKAGTIVPFLSGATMGEKLPVLEVPPLDVSSKIHDQYGLEISTKIQKPEDHFELDNKVSNHGEGDERNVIRDSSNVKSFFQQNWKVFAGIGSVAFLIGVAILTVIFTSSNRRQVATITSPPKPSIPTVKGEEIRSESTRVDTLNINSTPDMIFAINSPSVVFVATYDLNGKSIGFGSGFLIHKDGLIATNYHVIANAKSADAIFSDKTRMPVIGVIAFDPKSDIAILKIAAWENSPPPMKLSNSETPKIGLKVYAIGNPQGLSNTLSDGLVSGNREFDGINFIQTTTPISKGSSGGPLIDPMGNVIGLTTWYAEGGQNLNFAAPVSQIKRFLEIYDPKVKPRQLPLIVEPSVFDYCSQGIRQYENKKYNEAIVLFDLALSKDPTHKSSHIFKGMSWIELKEYDKGILAYTNAIRLDPKDPVLFKDRAEAWMLNTTHFDAVENAISDFTESIRLDSKNAWVLFSRSRCWLKKNNFRNAISDVDAAIQIDPKNVLYLIQYSWILSTCWKNEIRDGNRALKLATLACEYDDWKSSDCLAALAAAYAENGQFDAAVFYQTKAMQVKTNDKVTNVLLKIHLGLYEKKMPIRQ